MTPWTVCKWAYILSYLLIFIELILFIPFFFSYRIDWEEEGPSLHGNPDDSSDEEYLPTISLRWVIYYYFLLYVLSFYILKRFSAILKCFCILLVHTDDAGDK